MYRDVPDVEVEGYPMPLEMNAWLQHLRICDQCNYDKPCLVCDSGLGPDEGIDPIRDHSCNCPQGMGEGYALRMRQNREDPHL